MKVSLNWIEQFLDFELPPVDELVGKIGAQLGAIEEVVNLGEKYQGIVVARVITCEKHPNADKLHVCTIDDGGTTPDVKRDENGHLQVVCGAPNVREGLMVAWLPPGVIVPSTYGTEPFVLEAREIRGVVSNGMLASASELAISDDHSGILEIDKDAAPGTGFAELYKLDDHIIDIENKMFTHRPDCFGALGVAREVAGILHQPFKSPDWYRPDPEFPKPEGGELELTVQNDLPELVSRFTAVTLRDVTVGPSPIWLQVALSKVGQKSINSVVDLTNFWMLVTGQPLHAYDYDKVKNLSDGEAKIVVRYPRQGERIKLLNGKEIEPRNEAIMIATDKQLIGVGGVMGGSETEVDETTRNIILECANFDMYSIRRTSMAHGLFTDAVTRFNKGQSPLQNLAVSAKVVGDIQKLAGGRVAGELVDIKHNLPETTSVHVTNEFINARLGERLSAEDMAQLLRNVEFNVTVQGPTLEIKAPFWRADIEIPEDVVEEVGRLYGYDHLPLELPKRTIKPVNRDELLSFKSKVRDVLSKAGASEVLTYSFVHGNLLDKVGQDKEEAFELSNAISPDLQYYRLSLAPSLLEKIHSNIKAGHDEFVLFEIGKAHAKGMQDDESLPMEFNRIALVSAADPKTASQNYGGAAFYQAQKYLNSLLTAFGKEQSIELQPLEQAQFGEYFLIEQMTKPYDPKRSAVLLSKGFIVGVVGEYRASVARALKLPKFAAGFETFHSFLLKDATQNLYTPLSRFPKVQQDISLRVSKDLHYQVVVKELFAGLAELTDENLRTELEPLDIYQKGDAKHFTFRLTAAHYEKTLKAAEINELLDNLAERVKQKFGAERL